MRFGRLEGMPLASAEQRVMARPVVDGVAVALLVIAGIFLFANLGSGYLWQDEAETAVLARNTLKFGYPRAFDGRNYVDIDPAIGYGPGESWIYSPWLPFYLLAGVFAVTGESTGVARVTFAVFGFVSVWLAWRLACRLTADRRIQRLSVALLVCSVPFLLHARQCRYYSLTTALVLGVCLVYLALLRRPSARCSLLLGGLLALLFHTNFGIFIPVSGAVAAHQLLGIRRAGRRHLLLLTALVAVLTVPWAAAFYKPGAFVGRISLGRFTDHLEYYVRITNKYLVPLAVMLASSGLWWIMTRRSSQPPKASRRSTTDLWFLALVVGFQAAFLLIVPDQRHMRYLIPILPLMLIGEAWWLAAWLHRNRLIGSGLIAAALFTNVLQSPHVRIPLADFAYELTHPYVGPMEGVVAYLKQHARSDDVVKIPYDERTLMFYTGVRVERPSQFLQETDPDWVVIRRDWIPPQFFESDYFRRIQATYERIELNAPDILWQNREDPGSHHFRTVQGGPRVVIYHKRMTPTTGRVG